MKQILKIIFLLIGIGIIGIGALFYSLSMSLPEGEEGPQAEVLAKNMLASLNYNGFQEIEQISWTFRGLNSHIWNKNESWIITQFEEGEVLLNFKTGDHKIHKGSGETLIQEAKAYFYNDSFWLVAPFKIFDKGTSRKFVETEDGPGLLVTYNSGGLTPGDSYLWVLDENSRPKYWRVWTSNVPIPGMRFEWTDWGEYDGVWFSRTHPAFGPLSIEITNLEIN